MIRSVKVHNKTGLIRSVHGVSDQPRMKGPAGGAEKINWKETIQFAAWPKQPQLGERGILPD